MTTAWVTLLITIAGNQIPIISDSSQGLFISESCRKGEQLDCDASRSLKLASMKALRPESLVGGANPGALICMQLGGTVALASDARKNSTSYCRFGDSSVVASGTLSYYARKNDEKK